MVQCKGSVSQVRPDSSSNKPGTGSETRKDCSHPDAQWLCRLFPKAPPSSLDDAVQVFMGQPDSDAKSLCFAGILLQALPQPNNANRCIHEAAELGFPLAVAELARLLNGSERADCAKKAADLGEPHGMALLAECLEDGNTCEADAQRAMQLWQRAAELDCAHAQYIYALRLEGTQKVYWLHKAASNGCHEAAYVLHDQCSSTFETNEGTACRQQDDSLLANEIILPGASILINFTCPVARDVVETGGRFSIHHGDLLNFPSTTPGSIGCRVIAGGPGCPNGCGHRHRPHLPHRGQKK